MRLAFLLLILSFTIIGKTQIVGGCSFMKGSYVEVGIAPNGAFGTPENAPVGYHSRPSTGAAGPTMYNPFTGIGAARPNALGFVADYGKDGWSIGSPPYFGDYFMPGTIQEGWSIEVNGIRSNAWSRQYSGNTITTGFSNTNLTGSVQNYTLNSNIHKTDWSGSFINNLKINTTTTLIQDKSYFVTSVVLKNTGTDTLRKVYYMRTVDPDNEVTTTGSYVTNNRINFQLPNAGSKVLVTAKGTTHNSYLGLGTKDCAAKVFILQTGLSPDSALNRIYDQLPNNYIYSGTQTIDVGIGLVFNVGNISPGDSATFAYAYILNETDLDEAFSATQTSFLYNSNTYVSGDVIVQPVGTILPIELLNASGSSWSWSPTTNITPSIGTLVNITVGTVPITYTVIPNNIGTGSCNTIPLTITIAPFPVAQSPTVVSPVNYCKNAIATPLQATGTGILKWYTSPIETTFSYTAPMPSTATVGTTYYYVSQVIGASESARVPIQVIINDLPVLTTLNITSNAATCNLNNGIMVVNPIATTFPYEYSINGTTYQPSNIFSGLSVNIYNVFIKDNNGCIASVVKTISAIVPPQASASTSLVNCDNNNGSITINATLGLGPYTYSLNGVNYYTTNLFTNLAAGNYTAYVKDASNCISTLPIILNSINDLTLNMGSNPIICEGKSVAIQANSNATNFSWLPTLGLNNPNILNPITNTSVTRKYYLTATKGICSKQDSIEVFVNLAPIANAGADTTICFSKDVQLNGSGGIRYLWQPTGHLNNITIQNPTALHPPKGDNIFTLQVTNTNNCTSIINDTVIVTVKPPAKLFVGNDTIVSQNQPLQLNALDVNGSGFVNYVWVPSTGLSNPFNHSTLATLNSAEFTYTVTATSAIGCVATDDIKIKTYKGPYIYIPNAFTPNKDGLNDVLKITVVGMQAFKHFKIYNRFGQLLFATQNYNIGWDGTFKGKIQDPGTYVWYVEAIDFLGKPFLLKGTVIIIR